VEEPFFPAIELRGVNVRRTEIHTVEPLVPEPSAFEVELAIEKLKSKVYLITLSPGADQIPGDVMS